MSKELLIDKPPKDSNSYTIEMYYLMWFLLMCDMENENE